MHEVEVDVVHTKPFEARSVGGKRRLEPLVAVPDLGRDEYLGAIDSGCGDCPADALLVAVERGRVDVPVAEVECGGHGLFDILSVLDLVRAEAKEGDLDGAVKGNGGVK